MKLTIPPVASLIACGAMLGTLGSAATAQDTGSLVRPAPAQMGDESGGQVAARKTMNAFAVCSLKRNRNGVIAYLETFPGSAEAQKQGKRLSTSDCLDNGKLTFSEGAFRGAAHQALYRQTFALKPVGSVADRPSPDYTVGADRSRNQDLQAIALRQFSDCVVRANSSGTHALAISVIGSNKENTAFGLLGPNLSACLPNGQTLAFSRNTLRNALVEVLYRLRVLEPVSKQGQ